MLKSTGDAYWIDSRPRAELGLFAELALWVVDVVPRNTVKEQPDLQDLELLRQPQMGNPSYFTPQHLQILRELVPKWPTFRDTVARL